MCNCPGGVVIGAAGVDACRSITIDTLQLYRNLVVCVQNNGNYAGAGSNPVEMGNALDLLDRWIAAKQQGDDGCDQFFPSMPILQELTKRIILSRTCP